VVVMRVDDGSFVDVNPAFEHVTGWTRAEAIGRMPIELGIWRGHEMRALIWGRLRTQQSVTAEPITFHDRSGAAHHATLGCELFDHEGEPYVISILQDIGAGAAPTNTPGVVESVESYRSLFHAAAEGIY